MINTVQECEFLCMRLPQSTIHISDEKSEPSGSRYFESGLNRAPLYQNLIATMFIYHRPSLLYHL